jgi:hypothetical protein
VFLVEFGRKLFLSMIIVPFEFKFLSPIIYLCRERLSTNSTRFENDKQHKYDNIRVKKMVRGKELVSKPKL